VEAVEYFLLPLPASFFKVLSLAQKFNRLPLRFHIPGQEDQIKPMRKFISNTAREGGIQYLAV